MLCANRLRGQILQAISGQKEDSFEPIHLGNYRYWWKMVCDFWAHYQLPFFWLCSFIATWILFFFFFLILLRLSTFEPLNTLYLKLEQLKISRWTSARMKLGVPGWGDPPQTGPPNFWTFKPLELDQWNFWNG